MKTQKVSSVWIAKETGVIFEAVLLYWVIIHKPNSDALFGYPEYDCCGFLIWTEGMKSYQFVNKKIFESYAEFVGEL